MFFFTKFTEGCKSKRVCILIYYNGKFFMTGYSQKLCYVMLCYVM